MVLNPHKLGVHKILKHIPLNAIFDAPSKARLRKAVNIADLRLCAKQRAHKVKEYCSWFFFVCTGESFIFDRYHLINSCQNLFVSIHLQIIIDGF